MELNRLRGAKSAPAERVGKHESPDPFPGWSLAMRASSEHTATHTGYSSVRCTSEPWLRTRARSCGSHKPNRRHFTKLDPMSTLTVTSSEGAVR